MLDSRPMRIESLSGGPVPVDRFGQPLSPGDLLTYTPADPLVFRVVAVRPVLDRGVPPGTVRLQIDLVSPVTLVVSDRAPAAGLHRVGYLMPDGRTPMIGSAVPAPSGTVIDVPGPQVPDIPGDKAQSPAPPAGPRLILPPA